MDAQTLIKMRPKLDPQILTATVGEVIRTLKECSLDDVTINDVLQGFKILKKHAEVARARKSFEADRGAFRGRGLCMNYIVYRA